MSAVATTSVAANAENFYNTDLAIDSTPDMTAISEVFLCAEGSASFVQCGVEALDTETYNPQNNSLPQLWDPWLMPSNGKIVPISIVWHDTGFHYGHDLIDGTGAPSVRNSTYFGQVTGVGANSFTVTPTVPLSVNSIAEHDDGVAFNEANAVALVAAYEPIWGVDFYVDMFAPAGQFRIVTPIVVPTGSGYHLHGVGGLGTGSMGSGNGILPATRLIYSGVEGGVLLSLTNQIPFPNLMILAPTTAAALPHE